MVKWFSCHTKQKHSLGIQSWMPTFTRAPFCKTTGNVNLLVEKDLMHKIVQNKITNLLQFSNIFSITSKVQNFVVKYKQRGNIKHPRGYEMQHPNLSNFNFARFQTFMFCFCQSSDLRYIFTKKIASKSLVNNIYFFALVVL